MGTLSKVIKTTKTQYNTLVSGGTVGSQTGIDADAIYLVENSPESEWINIGTITQAGRVGSDINIKSYKDCKWFYIYGITGNNIAEPTGSSSTKVASGCLLPVIWRYSTTGGVVSGTTITQGFNFRTAASTYTYCYISVMFLETESYGGSASYTLRVWGSNIPSVGGITFYGKFLNL